MSRKCKHNFGRYLGGPCLKCGLTARELAERNPIAAAVTHIAPQRIEGKKRIKRFTAAQKLALKQSED